MRKRFPNKDWEKCCENFSDLIKTSNTPPRKKTKKSATKDKFLTLAVAPFSQDGSIQWSSSDDEALYRLDHEGLPEFESFGVIASPVLNGSRRKSIDSSGSIVKSTPSGSPILSQRRFSTVQKRSRKPSLLPISPITPGIPLDSFAGASYLSLHANENSNVENSGYDHTPLAVPLPDSDADENLEDLIESQLDVSENCTLTGNTIEDSTTQASEKEIELDGEESCNISALENESNTSVQELSPKDTKETSSSNNKGSSWIESLVGRLDEKKTDRSSVKSSMDHTQPYDSAKKKKFIKDGLAEQLQRVLKQEQTRKVLFQHQLKETNQTDNQGPQSGLTLKIVSHHKEGILHIMECKVLPAFKKGNTANSFYTLLFRHDDVIANNLNLTSVFTIYPPWKEMKVEQHDFPVLMCIYHLEVETSDLTTSFTRRNDSEVYVEQHNSTAQLKEAPFHPCESLLEALESQQCAEGVCLAATIQRIYRTLWHGDAVKKTFLCEDAFGIFFEIVLDAALCSSDSWVHLIKYGEGQRVYFSKLYLKGRMNRVQLPALFNLIDYIWNPSGFGLLQVQNSQSQSQEAAGSGSSQGSRLQPPSFCYKLLARREVTTCMIPTETSHDLAQKNIRKFPKCSELNRPDIDGSILNDVLYQATKWCKLSNFEQLGELSLPSTRWNIVCKILHKHYPCPEQSESDAVRLNMPMFYVADETSDKIFGIEICNIFTLHVDHGDVIVIRDLQFSSDGCLLLDAYSHVVNIGKSTRFSWSGRLPRINAESVEALRDMKFPFVPFINEKSEPGSFVKLEGVICSILPQSTDDVQSRSTRNIQAIMLHDCVGQNGTIQGEFLNILVIVQMQYRVKLKVLYSTVVEMLNFQSVQDINSTSLIGKTIGPVVCFVYGRFSISVQRSFVAEEVAHV
ncbi:uncharacterized protein LOC143451419 isoform X1 [Clavelina lepadiformis]|uniref:uncharacterized protein LOC143451419 isoform X1 n=1 Tax=Clavelina lepadiformis TaxID=159417 RepID=UPI004041A4AB